MNKKMFGRVALLVGCFGLVSGIESMAQQEAIAGIAEDRESDHQELRQIREAAEKAINENQIASFEPYLAPGFSIVTYTDREFTEFESFQSRWKLTREELLQGGTYSTEFNPEPSILIGNVAIARGNSHNVLTTGSGKRYEFPSHWTAVLQKQDGEWKVIRAHSSLSPFDNPMTRDTVFGMILRYAIGAFFGGLISGMLLVWLLKMKVSRSKLAIDGQD